MTHCAPGDRLKLVVTGPVGAGKTTAIAAVSDIDPITTDELATDETALLKPRTTVALDFGLVRLDGGAEVHLYGTPGQARFDFMWEVLAEGALGVLILVDATMPDADHQLGAFIDAFAALGPRPVAVGITHLDLVPGFDLTPLHRVLDDRGLVAPVLSVDPRDPVDVALLIEALVATLDPDLV